MNNTVKAKASLIIAFGNDRHDRDSLIAYLSTDLPLNLYTLTEKERQLLVEDLIAIRDLRNAPKIQIG